MHLRSAVLKKVFARRAVARARDHAHDGQRRRIFFQALGIIDMPSNRILTREESLRKRLIDDQRVSLPVRILWHEVASPEDRHPHRLEKSR